VRPAEYEVLHNGNRFKWRADFKRESILNRVL